ncbi:MAG: hypothetical protein FWD96_06580, partial [Defluviitaleaceae bacterium]|nr:hypothetical protein [Defluviitaleaceae bacterium]
FILTFGGRLTNILLLCVAIYIAGKQGWFGGKRLSAHIISVVLIFVGITALTMLRSYIGLLRTPEILGDVIMFSLTMWWQIALNNLITIVFGSAGTILGFAFSGRIARRLAL